MAGDAAARGIRDHDQDGSIGLVGAEPDPPYARPPLSKGLWQGKGEETIWRGTADLGVDLHLGRRITGIDLEGRVAIDDQGESFGWERLLLATGGRPRRLPSGGDADVVYYRTVADYRHVRPQVREGVRFVVIGGGFIGSESAAATSEPMKGVEVLPGELVEGIEEGVVRLGGGRKLEADVIIAGLGIEPATNLAQAAGLLVDDGIIVDDRGHVDGRDDVFAAGDVARFPAKALGKYIRVEHEDHANSHGRAVGANMAGADAPYGHLPFFYSDLFELGYEAVGEVDSRLDRIASWAEPNRKGVVCYVDGENRPRGFLLWDVWGKVDEARALIEDGEPVGEEQVEALIG